MLCTRLCGGSKRQVEQGTVAVGDKLCIMPNRTPVEVMKLRKGDPELKAADPVDAHVVARSLAAAAAEGAEGVYARLLQQQ